MRTNAREAGTDQAAAVTQTLATAGRYLRGLRLESASLESIFLDLTSENREET